MVCRPEGLSQFTVKLSCSRIMWSCEERKNLKGSPRGGVPNGEYHQCRLGKVRRIASTSREKRHTCERDEKRLHRGEEPKGVVILP